MKGRRRVSEDDTAGVYRPETRLQPIRPVKDPGCYRFDRPAPPNYLYPADILRPSSAFDGFNP